MLRAGVVAAVALTSVAHGAAEVGSSSAADTVAQTWGPNSMRLKLAPASLPPKAAARLAKQEALVKQRGLKELPSALVDTCQPGTAAPLAAGAHVTSGNLQASADSSGSIKFSRVDTGKELFTAKPRFTRPTFADSCMIGALMKGGDISVQNMTVPDAISHCAVLPACVGFTTKVSSCDSSDTSTIHECYFKNASVTGGNDDGEWRRWSKPSAVAENFLFAGLTLLPADASERVYGLGQGNWTQEGGCPTGEQRIVPLERNGQLLKLQQRKFHVTIPFAYSSLGYGFLFNMPGAGTVSVGEAGAGGMDWTQEAALGLDFWVSAPPKDTALAGAAEAIYSQYADATGHAPPLREDAMIFWQSRNRYKSSAIAMAVAERYAALDLPVGVLVIDYKDQHFDGDFAPNPDCYPSVKALSDGIRTTLNATTVFSFWPEAKAKSAEFDSLNASGCLINSDLGGLAIDATGE